MDAKKRREKNTEYQRAYRKKHPERITQSNQDYYKSHKDAILERNKANRDKSGSDAASGLLQEHRRSLGLSQQKYAAALGVTQATLSMWERGIVPINLETVSGTFPELGNELRKIGGNDNGK